MAFLLVLTPLHSCYLCPTIKPIKQFLRNLLGRAGWRPGGKVRVGVSVERNREEKGILVDGLAHDVRVEVCGDSIGGEGMCGVGGGDILMRGSEGILMGMIEDILMRGSEGILMGMIEGILMRGSEGILMRGSEGIHNTVVPPPFNALVHAFCSWHAASRHGV